MDNTKHVYNIYHSQTFAIQIFYEIYLENI
jgi:hypothetical protein